MGDVKPVPNLVRSMCHDLARYALRKVKGAGSMEVQELADRLEEKIEEAQSVILGDSK